MLFGMSTSYVEDEFMLGFYGYKLLVWRRFWVMSTLITITLRISKRLLEVIHYSIGFVVQFITYITRASSEMGSILWL
jgi:hypothetical protein